jgi:RHS repeat-associated protein
MVTNEAFDFKGNLLQSSRQLAVEYKTMVDWSQSPELEQESFTTTTGYDALDRPVSLVTPDASEIRHIYNEANLLEKVDVRLRGAVDWTPFVLDMGYNAKGQREKIEYGSGVITEYDYDPDTFRLTRLITTRNTDNKRLQDLSYTYDPVENITEIGDAAQQTVFFNNQVVNPSGKYEYDALYQLVKAEGREHAGQKGNNQPDHRDIPRMPLPHANDAQALRRYTEQYEYDAVGDILKMIHQALNGNWTRRYQYAANNNRLLATSLPGDPEARPYTATYEYDEHGNMTRMPHLPEITWDHKDRMHEVDLVGGGTAYYVYDAEGQRVRKVHEHNGTTIEERIYIGDFEIYRKRNGSGLVLERETLHLMDDEQRIALVETKSHDRDPIDSPSSIARYQVSNHLGSSSLELDENGSVISYEEYHPYGATSYHSARSGVGVSLKRYRYTGKERDEETGLNYHGARYYLPWLGRWMNCDPKGLVDGVNLYQYTMNNAVRFSDYSGTQTESFKDFDISDKVELNNSLPDLPTPPGLFPYNLPPPPFSSKSQKTNLFPKKAFKKALDPLRNILKPTSKDPLTPKQAGQSSRRLSIFEKIFEQLRKYFIFKYTLIRDPSGKPGIGYKKNRVTIMIDITKHGRPAIGPYSSNLKSGIDLNIKRSFDENVIVRRTHKVVKRATSKVGRWIKNIFSKIASAFSRVGRWIKNIFSKIASAFSSLGRFLINTVKETIWSIKYIFKLLKKIQIAKKEDTKSI